MTVTVEPADALVVVVGPDGYLTQFTGEQTLVQLEPGSYAVYATRDTYTPAHEDVEVVAQQHADVSLDLDVAVWRSVKMFAECVRSPIQIGLLCLGKRRRLEPKF